MRLDIMVDIETLGKNTDSTIFQISAVVFDITTGNLKDSFNKCVDISKEPIKADGSTLKWWLSTNKELFSELLLNGEVSESELIDSFQSWLFSKTVSNDVYLWGNGILFDNKILQAKIHSFGLKYPIFYRNDRDLRTLIEMASLKLGTTPELFKETVPMLELRKHDAYGDVMWQIALAHKAYITLME